MTLIDLLTRQLLPLGVAVSTAVVAVPMSSATATQVSGTSAAKFSAVEPVFTVVPNSVAFGSVVVGDVSTRPQTITVANIGSEPLTVTSVALAGGDASDFRIGPDACTGVSLAATETCAVTVNFAPKSTGGKYAYMSVSVDEELRTAPRTTSRSISQSAALYGTAIPVPQTAFRCRGVRATIVGTHGSDTLRGTAGRDVIAGLEGNDSIRSRRGNDLICGGSGHDRLSGGPGADGLFGGSGNDALNGGPGRDRQVR